MPGSKETASMRALSRSSRAESPGRPQLRSSMPQGLLDVQTRPVPEQESVDHGPIVEDYVEPSVYAAEEPIYMGPAYTAN